MKKDEDLPAGYEVPLHRSLTQPLFWGGVPRNVLLAEVLAGVVGGIFFKTLIVPGIAVCVHFICRYLGQFDPNFLGVFWNNKNYKSYYKP